MSVRVVCEHQGHRLAEAGASGEAVNAFLAHLTARRFSPATVRGYAYDLANFSAFLVERALQLGEVVPATCSTIWTGRRSRDGRWARSCS